MNAVLTAQYGTAPRALAGWLLSSLLNAADAAQCTNSVQDSLREILIFFRKQKNERNEPFYGFFMGLLGVFEKVINNWEFF